MRCKFRFAFDSPARVLISALSISRLKVFFMRPISPRSGRRGPGPSHECSHKCAA